MTYVILVIFISLLAHAVPAAEPDCDSCEAPLPQGCERVCNGAKTEGQVVLYISVFSNQLTTLGAELKKSIPFVDVRLIRLTRAELTKRVLSEIRARKETADIILSVDTAIAELLTAKAFKMYRSPFKEDLIPAFTDEADRWTSPVINPYALIYNTKLVRRGDAPKDLYDFLDPRWKGRIAIVSPDPGLSSALISTFGLEKARNYVNQLAAQNPVRIPQSAAVLQLLAGGESSIGINYMSAAINLANRGAPVAWNLPTPTITRLYPMGIVASAPHPNAAKLFYDFVLSRPGQTLFSRFGMIPANLKRVSMEPLKDIRPQDFRTINVQDRDLLENGLKLWQQSFPK